jgi:hypothetical protein
MKILEKKHHPFTATSASLAMALLGSQVVNAAENPFSLNTINPYQIAVDTSAVDQAKEVVKDAVESMSDAPGRDMAGNMVDYDYGGDSKGSYADGKIGTGAKDPSVCGSFDSAVCGADGGSHLK